MFISGNKKNAKIKGKLLGKLFTLRGNKDGGRRERRRHKRPPPNISTLAFSLFQNHRFWAAEMARNKVKFHQFSFEIAFCFPYFVACLGDWLCVCVCAHSRAVCCASNQDSRFSIFVCCRAEVYRKFRTEGKVICCGKFWIAGRFSAGDRRWSFDAFYTAGSSKGLLSACWEEGKYERLWCFFGDCVKFCNFSGFLVGSRACLELLRILTGYSIYAAGFRQVWWSRSCRIWYRR